MELSDLLAPDAIRVVGQISSKKRLLVALAEMLPADSGLPVTTITAELLERESLGSTGVGQGIAIPHARLEGVQKVMGFFIKMEKPLDYDSVDRQPVDLVFGLFAPKDTNVTHLKALALVSRTMRDPTIVKKLRANSDPKTLYAILTELRGAQSRVA